MTCFSQNFRIWEIEVFQKNRVATKRTGGVCGGVEGVVRCVEVNKKWKTTLQCTEMTFGFGGPITHPPLVGFFLNFIPNFKCSKSSKLNM